MSELMGIIQRHLDSTGATEAEFARRIGAAPQTVNAWKNRGVKKLPDKHLLEAVATITGETYSSVLQATLVDIGYAQMADFTAGRRHAGAWELGPELMVRLALEAKRVESDTWTASSVDEDDDVEEVLSALGDLVSSAEDLAEIAGQVAVLGVGGATHLQIEIDRERERRKSARGAARRAGRAMVSRRTSGGDNVRSLTSNDPAPPLDSDRVAASRGPVGPQDYPDDLGEESQVEPGEPNE